MTTLRVFIGLIFVLAPATAQVQLRGTLSMDGNPAELMIELRPSGSATVETLTSIPGLHGQFDFANVKAGHYVLSVKNRHGDLLKEEQLFLNNSNYAEVMIRLGERKPPEGRGTVNVNRLNHQVPKIAQKAMMRYRKCRDRNDEACAARYLNEAITADGELLEAYVNRSAIHIRARDWEVAIADLGQALRLDPQCALAHSNRAFVAIYRQEYRQAMVSAKAALRSEPDNLNAQYFLALAHVNLGEFASGFRELEKIAGDYEPARLTLAQAAPQRAALAQARLAKSAPAGTLPPPTARSAFADERPLGRP